MLAEKRGNNGLEKDLNGVGLKIEELKWVSDGGEGGLSEKGEQRGPREIVGWGEARIDEIGF